VFNSELFGGSVIPPRNRMLHGFCHLLLPCGAQDTFYVGNLKGVGRIYQQTFIDTYAKVACAKLYDRKTPITAADLLNLDAILIVDPPDRTSSVASLRQLV
jgi:hypothetical protein